jgi:outer membrane protein assembly factor BamA
MDVNTGHAESLQNSLYLLNKQHLNITGCCRSLLFLLFLLGSGACMGQGITVLSIHFTGTDSALLRTRIIYNSAFDNTDSADKELRSVLLKMYDNAYLAASYDSIKRDSASITAWMAPGARYTWASLGKGNADDNLLSLLELKDRFDSGKPFYYSEYRNLSEKILTYFENNGYPFASFSMDSVEVHGNVVSAKLNLQKNLQVTIDSIIVAGEVPLHSTYLQNVLDIRPGDLYDESKIRKVDRKLTELNFIRVMKPANVRFVGDKASIIVYPAAKKASQGDAIIGFAPNSDNDNKLLITGEVHLKLNNLFERGLQLDVDWRHFLIKSQDLQSRFYFPYLFNTPLGAEASFNLAKFDSTFINVNPGLGLQYIISPSSFLKFFVDQRRTILLLLDTQRVISTRVLPINSDVRSTLYGLNIRLEKLDNRFNPRRGRWIDVSAGIGERSILKNQGIADLQFQDNNGNFYSLYDSLKLKSINYRYSYTGDFFIPVRKRSTVNIRLQGAGILANTIFNNELYRFGGNRTLRGFDELSLYASLYAILRLEYRYILQENSFINIFWNGAYYENRSIFAAPGSHDTPFGFGAGFNFETQAGIFNISYALGKQLENPIQFKNAKIHFGLINYF